MDADSDRILSLIIKPVFLIYLSILSPVNLGLNTTSLKPISQLDRNSLSDLFVIKILRVIRRSLKCGTGLMDLPLNWLARSIKRVILSLLKAALSHSARNEFMVAFCSSFRLGPMKVVSSALNLEGSPEKGDLAWENRFPGINNRKVKISSDSFFNMGYVYSILCYTENHRGITELHGVSFSVKLCAIFVKLCVTISIII
jgi:hypothetical protein